MAFFFVRPACAHSCATKPGASSPPPRGAAYLNRDCLAHNAYRFHAAAGEVAVLEGDPVTAQFHAEQLDRYAELASCSWLTHHASLIRAFASGGTAPSAHGRARLRRLRGDAERHGFTHTMPRLHDYLSHL